MGLFRQSAFTTTLAWPQQQRRRRRRLRLNLFGSCRKSREKNGEPKSRIRLIRQNKLIRNSRLLIIRSIEMRKFLKSISKSRTQTSWVFRFVLKFYRNKLIKHFTNIILPSVTERKQTKMNSDKIKFLILNNSTWLYKYYLKRIWLKNFSFKAETRN